MPKDYGGSTTEERVVEMRIDNKQFEKGAKTTIKTLEKLDEALKIKGKSDAIDDLANSVSRFDASPISESFTAAFDNISAKGVIIARLISDLTHDIYNFGKKTIKELTVDQVSAGMDKYTQLAESTQTIMAATQDSEMFAGKTDEERLKVINDYLDQLLWYSDETSYSFTDMTSNLSKFIAAGVDLDDAVNAMMGISSWGASAGAKPAEVSRAMYNISQAMGAGSMKVVDWKSIENANMATLAFKENVLDIAYQMGKIKIWDKDDFSEWRYGMEDAKKESELFTAKSFREGLSEGWFDTDVMTEVFKRYGEFADRLYDVTSETGLGANEVLQLLDEFRESSSAVNWNLLHKETGLAIDDLKALFKYLDETEWAYSEQGFRMGQEYKTFAEVIDYTKDAVSSGWMKTFQYIFGDFLEAKELWSDIGDLFDDIFVSGGRFRNEVLKFWHGINEDDVKGREALIESFFNIVDAIRNIVGPIKEAIGTGILAALGFNPEEMSAAEFIGKRLADITARFRDFTAMLKDRSYVGEGTLGIITRIVANLTLGISSVTKVLGTGISFVVRWASLIHDIITNVIDFVTGKVSIKDAIGYIVEGFTDFGDYISSTFLSIIQKLGEKFAWLSSLFPKLFGDNNGKHSLGKIAASITQGINIEQTEKKITVLDKLMEVFEKISSKISTWKANAKSLGGFLGNMFSDFIGLLSQIKWADVWNTIKTSFIDFFTTVKGSIAKLFGISIDEGLTNALTRSGPGIPKPTFKEWISNLLPFAQIKDWLLSMLPFTTEGMLETLPAINWEQVLMKVLNVGTILAGIKALRGLGKVENTFAKVLKGFIGTDLNKFLSDVSSPLTAIAKIFSDENTGVLGLFGSIKKVLSSGKFRIEHKKVDSFGTTILKLAVSIGILAGVVYLLAKLPVEDATKSLTILGALALGLLAFGGLAKLFRIDGTPILKMAIALALLMIPLKLLSNMSWNSILKGATAIGLLMAELSLFTRISGKGVGKDSTVPFIKMALALLLLTIPLKQLAKMSWESLLKGLIGIGALLTELSLAMLMSGKGISKKNTTSFIKLALAVLILAVAVKQIGKMDMVDLEKGLGAILVLITGISLAMRAMSGVGKVKGFLPMVIAVAVLALVMKRIAKLSMGEIIKGALGLGAIMFMMSVLMNSIKGTSFTSSLGALLLIAGSLAAFVIAFKYLDKQNINFNNVLKFASSISAVMLSFGIMMSLLSKIPITGGLTALANAAIFIVGVGALFVGIGALNDALNENFDFDLVAKIESAGEVLGAIGLAIGEFIGGITSGIFDAVFDLPQLGADLSAFATNVQPFVDNMKGIDDSTTKGATSLANAILAIVGAEFLNKIASLFSEDLIGKFNRHIVTLGQALKSYAQSINGISDATTDSDNALAIATGLNNLIGEIDKEGGILGWLNGSPDINGFATGIVEIAKALVEYAMYINGFASLTGEGDIQAAIDAATGLAGLANALPATGGALQKIVGWQNLTDFGTGIAQVGEGLQSYALAIAGTGSIFNSKDAKAATETASNLVELQNTLPETGGILQNFFGEQNLSTFGNQLHDLGVGLYKYAVGIKDIAKEATVSDYKIAKTAATSLSELQNALPETGGILQEFLGEQNLATFGKQLYALGKGLWDYSVSVKDISNAASEDDLSRASSIADNLNDLNTKLPSTGGVWQLITGEKDLGLFATNITQLGQGLKGFADSIKDTDASNATTATSTLTLISEFVDGLDKTGGIGDKIVRFVAGDKWAQLKETVLNMGTFGRQFKAFSDGITSAGAAEGNFAIAKSIVADFISLGSEYQDPDGQNMYLNAYQKAFEVPQALANGLTDNANTFYSALGDLNNGTQTYYSIMYTNGESGGGNIAIGIANGIRNNAHWAVEAMQELADALMSGFNTPMEIESPSKVMMRDGMYIVQGLSQGINQNGSEAIDSITFLGDAMLLAMQRAMMGVALMADENFDIQPTISPVVDMTNANASASALNGMFGSGSRYLGFSSGIAHQMRDAARTAASMDQAAAGNYISSGDTINMNIYPSAGMNEEALADKVITRLSTRMIRRGVAQG